MSTCNTCIYLEGTPGGQKCGKLGNPIYGLEHLKGRECLWWHDKKHPQGATWPEQAKPQTIPIPRDTQGQEITIADLFPD